MKKWIIISMLIVAGLIGYVLAQFPFSVRATGHFIPIDFVDTNQAPMGGAPDIRAVKIEISDGVTCYLISSKSVIVSVQQLDQLAPLGCVK